MNVSQAVSHDAIARATKDCSDLLRKRQDEIRKFVRSLCYHVVEIRVRGEHHPQAMTAALDTARRPLLAELDQVIVPLEPLLTAELIAQPVPVIRDTVQQWLQTSSRTVANQLILSLHRLVELDVVGINTPDSSQHGWLVLQTAGSVAQCDKLASRIRPRSTIVRLNSFNCAFSVWSLNREPRI